MKVSDGLWLKRTGTEIRPAVEVAEVSVDEASSSVELLVACKHLADRGATLGGPLLTVKLDSPLEDVVRVNIQHFKGVRRRGPDFELFPDGQPPAPKVAIFSTDATVSLRTGGLTVEVDRSPSGFNLDFTRTSGASGKAEVVCSSGFKSMASLGLSPKIYAQAASETSILATNPYADPAPQGIKNFIQSELSLLVDERVYGFGELFGPLVKNGQSISIWQQDGGTSSEQGYKTIPFYLSSRGYGVFINHPGEVSMEVGSEKGARVGAVVAGEELEYWFINGPTLKEVLGRYTAITGRPGLPPTWSFGLWLSTSFTTDYSEKTVSGFLQGMKERGCPVTVMHLDCFWMAQFRWCDFTFDPQAFPDPTAYLAKIKKDYGVRVCLWINPYISQQSKLFQEGLDGGFFIKRKNGDVWQWDLWQPGLAVLDVTNPAACEWYVSKLEALLDMGVDAFKTDFAERIPHVDVKFHSGGDPDRVHNWYSLEYNRIVFELLERRFGKHEAVLFARSGTAGGQRFPVHWGGDCESTWEAMSESLRGGLGLTLSGYGFHSHDMGGFEGTPDETLFNRWLGYGLFSSHSRLHGSGSYRVPWIYGESCSAILAKLTMAKHRLMPYIYAAAVEAHETGVPIMRAMMLEFPEDLSTGYLDKQYMFGPSLLVAPVFSSNNEVDIYIPAGRWTSFWDPTVVYDGPKWVKEVDVPSDHIPVLVRPSTVLVLGPPECPHPVYDYASTPHLQAYGLVPGDPPVEVVIPTGKGPAIAAWLRVSVAGDQAGNRSKLAVDTVEGQVGEWVGEAF